MTTTSAEKLPRCRQCGAPLEGTTRRRCLRCHPMTVAAEAQLDLFFAAPAMVGVEPVETVAEVPEGLVTGVEPVEVNDEAPEIAQFDEALAEEYVASEEVVDLGGEVAETPQYDEAPPEEFVENEESVENNCETLEMSELGEQPVEEFALDEQPMAVPEFFALQPKPVATLVLERPQSWVSRFLFVSFGWMIVIGGLGWAGFQMWPKGPVERSLVAGYAAQPRFIERVGGDNPFEGIAVGGDSTPTLVDLDGDGLLDLVTGSRSGEIHVFRNTGTRTNPRFIRASAETFGLVSTDTSNSIAFADLRGIGLLDAVNAGTNGGLTFFQNRGAPRRPNFELRGPDDNPFAEITAPVSSYDWRVSFAGPELTGSLGLFVGTRDGHILFFENRGTAHLPRFAGVPKLAPFGLGGVGDLVSLAFGDLDGDGDLDAIAGNAAGELIYFENRGKAHWPRFWRTATGALGLPRVDHEATVALGDLNGDGNPDLVVGGSDGRFRYFENIRTPRVATGTTDLAGKR